MAPIKHYTASAIIINRKDGEDRVLLIKHKKFGLWMQPGGHQEIFENPLESVIREVLEETGIDISRYIPKSEVIDHLASELPAPKYLLEELIKGKENELDHYHLDQFYVVRVEEAPLSPAHGESQEIGWFTKAQCRELEMFSNLRVLLDRELS